MTNHTSHINGSELRSTSAIYITGNTYPHRDAIRAAGGRWNKTRNRWEIEVGSATMARRQQLSTLTFALRDHCQFASR